MALTNVIIRRAASRAAMPLTARTSGNQRYYHHQSCPTTGGASPSQKLFSRSIRYFTKAKPKDNEDTFLRVLDKEIKCEVECLGHCHEIHDVPENFPFNIEDDPMSREVFFSRNYQGEIIKFGVNMFDLLSKEDNSSETEEGESKHSMYLTVSKFDLPRLEFSIDAYKDKISINKVSVYDDSAYDGPDFGDLNQNLQKAFHKYLDIRGINASTISFLHEYMMNKAKREYVRWLENVKMIVEA